MKTNYRLLIIKGLVFLALFVGIDFLIGKVYRYLEIKALEHSPYGMVTEYTMLKVDADVVILGASEAQHSYIPRILEDSLGMSVYNCAKDGCGFYYQDAMINGILDRYKPKIIIWSIFPNELCTRKNDEGISELKPFYKENKYFRQILRTHSNFESIKLLSNSYIYNSKLLWYMFMLFLPDYDYEYGGYAPLLGCQNNLKITEGSFVDSYDETISLVFQNTIRRCLENEVQIVFVFTPRFEKGSYDKLVTYKQLKSVTNKYELPIIEDLYHSDELMKPQFFKDNAHLNHEGAEAYMKLFIPKLKEKISK